MDHKVQNAFEKWDCVLLTQTPADVEKMDKNCDKKWATEFYSQKAASFVIKLIAKPANRSMHDVYCR